MKTMLEQRISLSLGSLQSALAMGALLLGVATAAPAAPVTVIEVDCSAGETIRAALQLARDTFAPVTIEVDGVCKERIVIDRDEVTLRGVSPGAGLDGRGLTGTDPLVTVHDAHRVVLETLVLTSADITGLRLDAGASVLASRLQIEGGDSGISAMQNASLVLSSSSVSGVTGTGIGSRGAGLELHDCSVSENGVAGISVSGGLLDVYRSQIVKNAQIGIGLTQNAAATVSASEISDSAVGVYLSTGARASLGSTRVSGNRLQGIRVWDSSTLSVGSGTTIERNGAAGVDARGASVVVPQGTTIRDNGGDGIRVRDTGLVTVTSGLSPVITGNSGWGVACEGFPGDARLASPGFPPGAIFGNLAGQVSCPGYFVR